MYVCVHAYAHACVRVYARVSVCASVSGHACVHYGHMIVYLLSSHGKRSIKPLFKGVTRFEYGWQQEVEKCP